MTNEEARENLIEMLAEISGYDDSLENETKFESINNGIDALEKQIPKELIKLPESEQYIRYTDTYRCPTCGGNFSGTGIADYCYHCGQRLDWGEQEGENNE